MARMSLELPAIQNWSCHNCSGCCRQHAITVTDEEKARIESQRWDQDAGYPQQYPVFVSLGKKQGKERFRLGHQADGACVFLNEEGLCRIHAKFGEMGKPLACRVYPYTFHPMGKQVAVSYRFSCPSVVKNLGTNSEAKRKELERLAQDVVPKAVKQIPAPEITPKQQLEWKDFLKFIEALTFCLSQKEVTLVTRLRQCLAWMDLVRDASFVKIRGERVDDFLELLVGSAVEEVTEETNARIAEPGKTARTQFRLLVAQYARTDTFVDVDKGWSGRWRMLRAGMKFAGGRGAMPVFHDAFQPVEFTSLEGSFGPIPAEADELLTRLLLVKVNGLHFCGRAYYGIPLVEGFWSLSLLIASMFYLARWHAASHERQQWELEDFQRAVEIADHHHGFSPAFAQGSFRRRVRMLARMQAIPELLVGYG